MTAALPEQVRLDRRSVVTPTRSRSPLARPVVVTHVLDADATACPPTRQWVESQVAAVDYYHLLIRKHPTEFTSNWKRFFLQVTWLVSVPLKPGSQDYYWSEAWQEGEREATEEYHRGEAVSFDSAEDAIRWLRED